MTVESVQDQIDMLSDFGVEATLDPLGTPVTVTGIYDDSFLEVDIATGVQYSADQPTFFARYECVSGVAQSSAIQIDGEDFTVADINKQGDGTFALVRLHRS